MKKTNSMPEFSFYEKEKEKEKERNIKPLNRTIKGYINLKEHNSVYISAKNMIACLCDVVLLAQLPVCEGEDDLLLLLRLVVQVPAAQHQSSLILPITSLTYSRLVLSCLFQAYPAQSSLILPTTRPAYRSYSV
jgi:hypothetical protein